MSGLVGIGAYSQPMGGKLLGTGGCAPCAAAAANGLGTEPAPLTPEREAELNAQYEAWFRNALVISGVTLVGAIGLMWWLGARN